MHPTGGSLRVFKPFAWLEVDSVKAALSRPAHQQVTQTIGQLGTSKHVNTDYVSEATKLSLNKCDGNTFNAKSPET